jgi:hypothetical protein
LFFDRVFGRSGLVGWPTATKYKAPSAMPNQLEVNFTVIRHHPQFSSSLRFLSTKLPLGN